MAQHVSSNTFNSKEFPIQQYSYYLPQLAPSKANSDIESECYPKAVGTSKTPKNGQTKAKYFSYRTLILILLKSVHAIIGTIV